MDRQELLAAGIARQAELVADGTVSSRELTEACIERIEALTEVPAALLSVGPGREETIIVRELFG